MEFQVGDKVVYPMHGAGVVESIEEKEILGKKQEYYVLNFPMGGVKVMVPTQNVEQIGLRQVISKDEIDKVMDILSGEETKMPANWSKRYRLNMNRIKSGDIYEIAAVVRNLTLRDKDRGLSNAERKMLNSARQILISELALSKGAAQEEIKAMVDKIGEKNTVNNA